MLVRLYQVPHDDLELVRQITYATNSQNPVDLRDLRSNDQRQRALEISVSQLGYHYRRQRSDAPARPRDIASTTAAEAVLSVWRRCPQQAKFKARELFGKVYDQILAPELNGTQVVLAVLLWRVAERFRKRPPDAAPRFVPYAGAFLAMLMGEDLLAELRCDVRGLDHRRFEAAVGWIESRGPDALARSVRRLEQALELLYGSGRDEDVSLQQLSATFRRGDLLRYLERTESPR